MLSPKSVRAGPTMPARPFFWENYCLQEQQFGKKPDKVKETSLINESRLAFFFGRGGGWGCHALQALCGQAGKAFKTRTNGKIYSYHFGLEVV